MRARIVTAILIALAMVGGRAGTAPELDLIPPVDGPITMHFDAPEFPYGSGHRGIDVEAPRGSTVVAASEGVVAFAGQVGGRLFVSIDHPVGLRTTYSFLDGILVAAGDGVAQGQPIALSGTGHEGIEPPHLHFGLREGSDYLDPEPYLVRSTRRNLWRVVHLVPAP